MVEVSDNKIDLVLDKLISLERKFDNFKGKHNHMEFELKTMIELNKYDANSENYIRKDEKDFLRLF